MSLTKKDLGPEGDRSGHSDKVVVGPDTKRGCRDGCHLKDAVPNKQKLPAPRGREQCAHIRLDLEHARTWFGTFES